MFHFRPLLQIELLRAIEHGNTEELIKLNLIHKKRYFKRNTYLLDTIDNKTMFKYIKSCSILQKEEMVYYLLIYLSKIRKIHIIDIYIYIYGTGFQDQSDSEIIRKKYLKK